MKKVIIVGAGVAGLSAGIYAQKQGFSVEIYEKNTIAGGECIGWNRKGYHIDNCIHWLLGCDPNSKLHQVWEELGVLSKDVPLYYEPYFYMLDMDGVQLHFWADREKARQEFLVVAPEDTEEINKFFDAVKHTESMQIPAEKSIAEMNPIEYMKFGMGMAEMGKVMKEYGNQDVYELAERFKNPIVREMMKQYFSRDYQAFTLITSCAFLTCKTGAIPQGGSIGMTERMSETFISAGGVLHLGKEVTKVCVNKRQAEGIELKDGNKVYADYVICATDMDFTFSKLLDKRYMDPALRHYYECSEGYKTITMFHAAFGIEGEEDTNLPTGSVMFPCEEFRAVSKTEHYMAIRNYDYDETLFPKGKHVIQCNLLMDADDFTYWKELYQNQEKYKTEKNRIVSDMQERIEKKFPQLKHRLIFLEAYTPVTFERYCNAYKGAYMSFFGQKGYKSVYIKNTVKGLDNVFLASQWLQLNGGLPIAATSGKFAVQALMKADKKNGGSRL